MEWSNSLLIHFKTQTLLKINCCMAAISAFGVTQHGQIFSLFFRNRIQYIALYQLHNSQALLNLRRGYFKIVADMSYDEANYQGTRQGNCHFLSPGGRGVKRGKGSFKLCDRPGSWLTGVKLKWTCLQYDTYRKNTYFFIMKQSATVTETLLLHFLDYRILFEKQVQLFVHYRRKYVISYLKHHSFHTTGSGKGLVCIHRLAYTSLM